MLVHHCCGRQGTVAAYLRVKKPRNKRGSTWASQTQVHRADVSWVSSEDSLLPISTCLPDPQLSLARRRCRHTSERSWKLAAVCLADLVPPNEEATALHEAELEALCATNGIGSANEVKGHSPPTDDLRTLRTQLETLLLEAVANFLQICDCADSRCAVHYCSACRITGLARPAKVTGNKMQPRETWKKVMCLIDQLPGVFVSGFREPRKKTRKSPKLFRYSNTCITLTFSANYVSADRDIARI
jgi:hypothetical protein